MEDPRKKVLDRTASDNVYLHKDFHGAMCYAIKYLDDNFGPDAVTEYLQQVGTTVFSPLIEKIKKHGLSAMEEHLKSIFTNEGGDFTLAYEDGTLVLKVCQCPAVAHLKKIDKWFTDRYCLSTVVVNETICREAGFTCSCDYQPNEGRCVQKFWKDQE